MAGFNAEALRAPQETVVTAADSPGPAAASGPNWAELVQKIKLDDQSGMEDLYRVFSRGVRFYLCRQLGPQDLEDKVHDTFLIVVQAVRRGELREPERLMGFVRTVVRRQVAGHIDQAVHSRRQQVGLESGTAVVDLTRNPEETAIRQQHEELGQS
jgi:DNA-directed RNA polymerase specialized sigma24 family protein